MGGNFSKSRGKVSDVAIEACQFNNGTQRKGSRDITANDSVVAQLTEVQLEEFREAFNAFDKDGGGSIDKAELMDLFRSLGQSPSEEELDKMVKCADADGTGDIDFCEFAVLMAHLMHSQDSAAAKHQRLLSAFAIFDDNGNGIISADEVATIMWNLGEPIGVSDVTEIIQRFDRNGDGFIDYEEFAAGIIEEKLFMEPWAPPEIMGQITG